MAEQPPWIAFAGFQITGQRIWRCLNLGSCSFFVPLTHQPTNTREKIQSFIWSRLQHGRFSFCMCLMKSKIIKSIRVPCWTTSRASNIMFSNLLSYRTASIEFTSRRILSHDFGVTATERPRRSAQVPNRCGCNH